MLFAARLTYLLGAAITAVSTIFLLLLVGRRSGPIIEAPEFFYAEEYHQQYLAKNPGGYCGIGGTGVTCPVGVGV